MQTIQPAGSRQRLLLARCAAASATGRSVRSPRPPTRRRSNTPQLAACQTHASGDRGAAPPRSSTATSIAIMSRALVGASVCRCSSAYSVHARRHARVRRAGAHAGETLRELRPIRRVAAVVRLVCPASTHVMAHVPRPGGATSAWRPRPPTLGGLAARVGGGGPRKPGRACCCPAGTYLYLISLMRPSK